MDEKEEAPTQKEPLNKEFYDGSTYLKEQYRDRERKKNKVGCPSHLAYSCVMEIRVFERVIL